VKTILKELVAPDGKRNMLVLRRDDGPFGFGSLRFSEELLEICWIPNAGFSECFAPTAGIAEREARDRVDWLRDENDDG
jgi:hypothetical protein